ncbi:hypothetical protein IE53DRAFT_412980 [Violaceomyces palustris]|uniref:Uncharacterized protein n=1 Tax=Violaceomyces palustris TaxID=1673888 RepID=A0ACD0NNV9_9BASI|nr:hypothetical protein IE53DRAFT_412980 [Violaceomyces palustris]
MYNGIGLKTARGSGTNGYVQRNLSHVKSRWEDDGFKGKGGGSSSPFSDSTGARNVKADESILLHERKRKVEIQCLQLREELEELVDGGEVREEEVEEKVQDLRSRLMKELERELEGGRGTAKGPSTEEVKRLRPSDVHSLAQAKGLEEEKFKRALGVAEDYKEGDAFDRDLQERRRVERIEERKKRDEQRRLDWERKQEEVRVRRERFEEERRRREREREKARRYADDDRERRDFDQEVERRRRERMRDGRERRRSPSPPPSKRSRQDGDRYGVGRRSASPSRSPSPTRRRRYAKTREDSRSISPPPNVEVTDPRSSLVLPASSKVSSIRTFQVVHLPIPIALQITGEKEEQEQE